MAALIVLPMLQLPLEVFDVIEDILAAIMFFLLILIFSPPKDMENKDFPLEIFGFTYAVIFMFYCAGTLVIDALFVSTSASCVVGLTVVDLHNDLTFFGKVVMLFLSLDTPKKFIGKNLIESNWRGLYRKAA